VLRLNRLWYVEYIVLGRTRSVTAGERREWLLFALLVGPNFLLFFVFTFWPLIYNAYLSFFQWDLISPFKTWVGLNNYRTLLAEPDFHKVLLNTFYFTGVSVVTTTVLALALAVLLNQPLRWRNGVRTVMFAPVVLSGAAIGIVWIYVFDPRFGVVSTILGWFGVGSPNWLIDPRWAMPAVIIVYVWKNVGYAMVIFLAGLQAIPRELYEAARVDGASAWGRFRHITLPGLGPVMFFLVLTGVLSSFQAFDIIKTMTDGGPVDSTNTLIFYMYQQGFVVFNAGRAGVAAVLLFAMMLAFTVVQMRFSERRVTYG